MGSVSPLLGEPGLGRQIPFLLCLHLATEGCLLPRSVLCKMERGEAGLPSTAPSPSAGWRGIRCPPLAAGAWLQELERTAKSEQEPWRDGRVR